MKAWRGTCGYGYERGGIETLTCERKVVWHYRTDPPNKREPIHIYPSCDDPEHTQWAEEQLKNHERVIKYEIKDDD